VSGRFVLKIGDHLENAETKKFYAEQNFSEVAPRYDFITKVLSFRRDAAWKRTLISLLPCHDSPVCIDLACGTGDIAFLLASKYPRGRIAGVDITDSMVAIARHRNTHTNVSFANQDMGSLDIVSESVDIVTGDISLDPDQSRDTTTWQQRLSSAQLDPRLCDSFFGHASALKPASLGASRPASNNRSDASHP
jgi:SAM-dependent methyltransferase